jgi:hypothetical protein
MTVQASAAAKCGPAKVVNLDSRKNRRDYIRGFNDRHMLRPKPTFMRAALTEAFCKGRSKLYARYWCPNGNCKAVRLSKEQLESEFVTLLRRLRPEKNVVSSFPKIAAKAWADRQGATDKETRRLATHLEDQKRLKRNLLRAYLGNEPLKLFPFQYVGDDK